MVSNGSRDDLQRVGAVGAGVSTIIGAIALVGWTAGLPALTQLLSTRSAMQPVTALCAILMGSGILLALDNRHLLARALGLIVIVMALQTIAQFAFGADFGTDHLLFSSAVDAQPVRYAHPGRMSGPTATAFLLLGLGLVTMGVRGRVVALGSAVAATTVLLLITVALLGHLYLVAPLGGVLGFTQVALPTAVSLGGAAVGVLALRPTGGWVRLLVGRSIGAAAARWLLPVVVIVPVSVTTMALRGSEAGLYPADFRLSLTTTVTIALLAALALWGTAQLDKLVSVRQAAEALQESEATLRAFFETEGLFASILERRGDAVRYLVANDALTGIHNHHSAAGMDLNGVEGERASDEMLVRLMDVEVSGRPLRFEQCTETQGGTRWFATTISPIAGHPVDAPRFATASLEITDRKHAETQQRLLLDELNHRVKNTLAVVQSLAQQSFKGDLANPAAKRAFESRLMAVSAAHSLLVRQDWKAASIRALVADVVGPGCGADRERIDMQGPDVELPPHTAVSIALALHELCTNAVKYGGLSNEVGRVAVDWSVAAANVDKLRITWTESGGPLVTAPTSRGFGSKLIERALAAELGSPVKMDFRQEGLVCVIEATICH